MWGAWAVATFLAITGVILLTDRLLADLLLDCWDVLAYWYESWQVRRNQQPLPIQPELPVPSGEVPWWKRFLPHSHQSIAEEPLIQPPAAGRARALNPAPSAQQKTEPASQPAPRPRQPLTKPSEEAALTPRVVGGVQT